MMNFPFSRKKLFTIIVKLPFVKQYVEKEKDKNSTDFWDKYSQSRKNAILKLPDIGWTYEAIEDRMTQAETYGKLCYTTGKHSGAVYYGGDEHWKFISKIMSMHVVANPIHSDQFLPITQMEAEIIRMCCNLWNGDKLTCGVGTSGGTESILLAMLAYREKGRIEKNITKPNVVLSETAHAAFDKAGFYFNIEIRKVKVNPDLTANIKAMKYQIDSNTILLVCSAPEYPFGNYDPVQQIAAIAQSKQIGCHVDSCIGFVNAFAEQAGFKIPLCDFRVPGVTSISVDTHKFAFGPKGYSVLLFKNAQIRDYQFFTCMDWNGGFYATPSMAGSRPGNIIAGTWAAMISFGQKKYIEQTKQIFEAQKNIKLALQKEVPEIQIGTIHASPLISLIQLQNQTNSINCIALSDLLQQKFKWTLNKTMNPNGCKLVISETTAPHWRSLVDAIKQSIEMMKNDQKLNYNSNVALYGMAKQMPDTCVLDDICKLHTRALLDAFDDNN